MIPNDIIPADPMRDAQPVASRSSVSTDAVGVELEALREMHRKEHSKLGELLLDKTSQGVVASNWQGGRVNGIGEGIIALKRLAALRSAPPQQEAGPVDWQARHPNKNDGRWVSDMRAHSPEYRETYGGEWGFRPLYAHPSPAPLADETLRAEVEQLTKERDEARTQTSAVAKLLAYEPPYQASLEKRTEGLIARAEAAEAESEHLKGRIKRLEGEIANHQASLFNSVTAHAKALAQPSPEGRQAGDSEVLRCVMAMLEIRDGAHGYVPQPVRDFINATLDAYPTAPDGKTEEVEKLCTALRDVRAAIYDPVNTRSIRDTVRMPGVFGGTMADRITAALNDEWDDNNAPFLEASESNPISDALRHRLSEVHYALVEFATFLENDEQADKTAINVAFGALEHISDALAQATPMPARMVMNDPALRIDGIDEYGPMLGWFKPWTDFDIGTQFYAVLRAAPEPTT